MINKIKQQLPFKIDKIKLTDKGLTNHNYLLEIDKQKYMLRYPLSDVNHLFNYKNEEKIIKQLKDIDFTFKVKYFNNGILMTPYKENLITFDHANYKTRIYDVANLMKKLHKSQIKVDFDFNPVKQINLYLENIPKEKLEINLDDYLDLFNQYKNHTFEPILCHNDWVEGNICFVDKQVYLIDFEYAGNNDPYFDIMSFVTENTLTDDEKRTFINLMITDLNVDIEKILMMYRDLNNILWYLWAKMMYEFRKQNIYLQIADIKLKQLKSEYQKPLFT